nr:hypothetical protein [Natrinema gelatinilyticum]
MGDFETAAFLVDYHGLRRTVVVGYCHLVVTGFMGGVLFAVFDKLVTLIPFLATVPAAPVARLVFVAVGEINLVWWRLFARQPLIDCDEFVPVQLGDIACSSSQVR